MTQPIAPVKTAPVKKAPAKKASEQVSIEETLWDNTNKLRGSVESSEYKHIALSLVFLKFISDKFEAQRQKLQNEGMGLDFEEKTFTTYWPPARKNTISPLQKTR